MSHAAARGGAAVARALCGRGQLRGCCGALAPPPPRVRRASSTPVLAGIADLFRPSAPAAGRNGRAPLVKGTVSPRRPVPAGINRPPYADNGKVPPWREGYQVQDEQGVIKMRAAGKLAAQVLNYAGTLVRPGVTTEEIDAAVHAMIVAAGAYPSPLNYGGFPKSVCTSLNECICHGIPDTTVLQEGDIINIDVTVYLDGHHGDTSRTFLVGAVDPEATRLVEVTREALAAAIRICRPGVPFKEIGATIHAIADRHKLGAVPAFVGHGVGREFHSGPTIIHCRNNEPGIMAVGQTFTIEPMLTLGSPRERFWSDEWTAVTADGSWSAQFEHTLLIVPGGVEVLTMADGTPPVEGLPSPQEMAEAAAAHAQQQQARRPGGAPPAGGGGRPMPGRKGKK